MGTTSPVRTDLSATLFLSAPEDYDGGDLRFPEFGDRPFDGSKLTNAGKLPAGSMVLYPGYSVHKVAPVTRGRRLAAILWVQSMVRDQAQRRILFELDLTIGSLREKVPDASEVTALTVTYHNLLRFWSVT